MIAGVMPRQPLAALLAAVLDWLAVALLTPGASSATAPAMSRAASHLPGSRLVRGACLAPVVASRMGLLLVMQEGAAACGITAQQNDHAGVPVHRPGQPARRSGGTPRSPAGSCCPGRPGQVQGAGAADRRTGLRGASPFPAPAGGSAGTRHPASAGRQYPASVHLCTEAGSRQISYGVPAYLEKGLLTAETAGLGDLRG